MVERIFHRSFKPYFFQWCYSHSCFSDSECIIKVQFSDLVVEDTLALGISNYEEIPNLLYMIVGRGENEE